MAIAFSLLLRQSGFGNACRSASVSSVCESADSLLLRRRIGVLGDPRTRETDRYVTACDAGRRPAAAAAAAIFGPVDRTRTSPARPPARRQYDLSSQPSRRYIRRRRAPHSFTHLPSIRYRSIRPRYSRSCSVLSRKKLFSDLPTLSLASMRWHAERDTDMAFLSLCPSVRPSFHMFNTGIVSKLLYISSQLFHHHLFHFLRPTGIPHL